MSNERNDGPLTRQQLYERIRQTSKDEYTLSEMVRLGYWKENEGKPSLPAQLITKEAELQQQLNKLVAKQRLYEDPEKALKELHKERKKQAMVKREETRQAKNEARYQRALNWHQANQNDILYLGGDYSAGLYPKNNANDNAKTDTVNEAETDAANQKYKAKPTDGSARLSKQGLPDFASAAALAKSMGVSINELRFLSFGRKTTTVSHYQQFLIAKKTGGTRRISAPMPRLKRLQYWVLGNILEKAELHDAAHGFVSGASIVTNAKPHVGKDIVINMDLQNFFPTIDYKRIKGLFVHLGYAENIATILALLCSEPERDSITLDNQTFHVAKSERHLPQGAPTSPAISNLICRRLDKRIQGVADKLNFSYTRYADDLTFSYNGKDNKANVAKLMWRVKAIIAEEGFVVHPKKTRVMRKHQRQEVTGIVVNEKLSVNRATLKRFRALLFQIDKDGPAGKTWGDGELFHSITGFANYVAMVNPEKGKPFQEKVAALKAKYASQTEAAKAKSALNKKALRAKAIAGQAPTENWWQAAAPPVPEKEKTAEEIKAIKAEQRRQDAEYIRRNSPEPEYDDYDEYDDDFDDDDHDDNQSRSWAGGISSFFRRERAIQDRVRNRDENWQDDEDSNQSTNYGYDGSPTDYRANYRTQNNAQQSQRRSGFSGYSQREREIRRENNLSTSPTTPPPLPPNEENTPTNEKKSNIWFYIALFFFLCWLFS